MDSLQLLLIQTTCDRREPLDAIAIRLVEIRLAACVHISGPVDSIYRWQDRIDSSSEWILTAKSRADLFERTSRTILELHPYELPELIALPLAATSPGYLAWLNDNLA